MIESMATLRITEAELTRDVHRPVAAIMPPFPKGRRLSESIALAEARGTTAIPDNGFMKDIEEGIAERSQPWDPPTRG
jgi:hypothetical protein